MYRAYCFVLNDVNTTENDFNFMWRFFFLKIKFIDVISQEASQLHNKDFLSIFTMETSKHCWKYGALILKSKTHTYKGSLGYLCYKQTKT